MTYISKRHDILALFAITFCSCIFSGCLKRPVNTSQRILIESARALSSIDTIVARNITNATDDAIEHVREQLGTAIVAREQCMQAFDDCNIEIPDPMALYHERMETWNNLTEQLELAADFLQTWEEANNIWRETRQQPANWQSAICEPLGRILATVSNSLERLDVEVPELWRGVVASVPQICVVTTNLVEVSSGNSND